MKKPLSFIPLFLLFATHNAMGQGGALDLSFDPGTGANNEIKTIALQTDKRIAIGGDFTLFNGRLSNRIARLNSNGSVDTSFDTQNGFEAGVRAIAIQPDGKIIAAGDFQFYNGIATKRIARLNTDGTLDTNFITGTGFNEKVYAIAIDSAGKIVVGGNFTSFNGHPCNYLVRLNTDGSYDATFNTGTGCNGSVNALAVQPDGKIVIGGDFTFYAGSLIVRVARINSNGILDATFSSLPGPNKSVNALALYRNGRILVGGNFTQYNLLQRNYFAKILADGSIDPQYFVDQGMNYYVYDVKVKPDGDPNFIVGDFTTFKLVNANHLIKVDYNCYGQDTGFYAGMGTATDSFINRIVFQPDGRILIGGNFAHYNGVARNRIARLYDCAPQNSDTIYGLEYAMCTGTQQVYTASPVIDAVRYDWVLPPGWTGSSDSATIVATSNGMGGIISVRGFTDSCGYSIYTNKTIRTIQPDSIPICLVTVDSQSTHNIIIWEKNQTNLIDSFFVYRETSSNVYTKIAAVPYDSLSEYHDTVANPNVTSYRYKLSVLDSCGAESALSPYHSTIHLQYLGNGNFQWTFYQIEPGINPVISFNFYRDNLGNGNFNQIGFIPGTNSTFTDLNFSSFPNAVYVVDANWSISCNPTRAVSTTRSNIKRGIMLIDTTIGIEELLQRQLVIYPNPATESITVYSSEEMSMNHIALFNSLGQIVWEERNTSAVTSLKINIESLPRGVYTLAIESNAGRRLKKVIVE